MMIKLHFYKVFTFYLSLLSSLTNGFYFLASCKIKIYNWFYQWWWSIVKAYILTTWGFRGCLGLASWNVKMAQGDSKWAFLSLILQILLIFLWRSIAKCILLLLMVFFEQIFFCFLLALPCYLIPNFTMLNSNLLTFPNYLSTTYNSPEWW